MNRKTTAKKPQIIELVPIEKDRGGKVLPKLDLFKQRMRLESVRFRAVVSKWSQSYIVPAVGNIVSMGGQVVKALAEVSLLTLIFVVDNIPVLIRLIFKIAKFLVVNVLWFYVKLFFITLYIVFKDIQRTRKTTNTDLQKMDRQTDNGCNVQNVNVNDNRGTINIFNRQN